MGGSEEGRAGVARAMRLCGGAGALRTVADVEALAAWAQNAWDYLVRARTRRRPPLQLRLSSAPGTKPQTQF